MFSKDELEIKEKLAKYNSDELEITFFDLKEKQSWLGVIVGSIVGSIMATLLYLIFSLMGGVITWFLFIPAGLIGFFSGYLGCSYDLKYRLLPGLIAILLHIVGVLFLFPNNPLVFLLTPACAGVAIYCAKRKLSYKEEKAIWSNKYEA